MPVPSCARVVPLFPGPDPAPASPASPASAPLEVEPAVAGSWRELPTAVRCHVARFLADATAPSPPYAAGDRARIVVPSDAPPTFAADLADGAPGLRAAFPALRRRVVGVDRDAGRIVVRIACEATHDGPFFGFMRPTGRAVHFAETHAVRVDGDRIADDRLAIDLRSIIRQLATPAPAPVRPGPAPTTRA